MVSSIYPNIEQNIGRKEYFENKAILVPTNEEVDLINDHMLNKIAEKEKIYYSSDTVCPTEINNSFDESSFFILDFLGLHCLYHSPGCTSGLWIEIWLLRGSLGYALTMKAGFLDSGGGERKKKKKDDDLNVSSLDYVDKSDANGTSRSNEVTKGSSASLADQTSLLDGYDVNEKRDMSKVTMRRPRPGRGKDTSIVQQGNPINTSPPSNEHVIKTMNMMEPIVTDWTDDDGDVNLSTRVDGGAVPASISKSGPSEVGNKYDITHAATNVPSGSSSQPDVVINEASVGGHEQTCVDGGKTQRSRSGLVHFICFFAQC
ncbi:hypothetical protein CTI12_AA360430 [Artemisia annua]|uniref:ATP-dependent DNA helicase n=1 Tax=Artemisia annua TaxID=35608 RepID=A0A2U1MNH4_ARTAN|nr:hypothetical protein CTI12_AA360430 [Artemisia annua]